MVAPPFIKFENITKRFGKNIVLNNLSLDVPFGEITGIIGPSGSGKTTILNLLVGFYKPNQGKIFFQSRDIFKDMKNIKGQFGFASQSASFYPKLTVKENLYYFGKLYSIKTSEVRSRTDELINLVELYEAKDTVSDKLSTGMKRRLDIACALINNPKVLILDEPTEDLDPILRREIVSIIRRINSEETTVLLTSHLLNEIEDLCDNIAILNNGKIIIIDTPKNLMKKYNKSSLDDVFEAIIKETNKDITKSKSLMLVKNVKKTT